MRMNVYNSNGVITALDSAPITEHPIMEWRRYQVLHDEKSPLWGYKVRDMWTNTSGVPEVNRFGSFDNRENHVKARMTEPIQFFWADITAMVVYGRTYEACNTAEKSYIGKRVGAFMGRAFGWTNRTSDDPVANYVLGENLNAQLAMMAALLCGGNTIWGKPAGVNKRGEEMVQVYSFIEGEALPPVNSETLLDARVQWATNVYQGGSVGWFPQLGGLPVPVPIYTRERYYFPAAGLEEYSHDSPKRPMYVRGGVPSYS